MPRWPEPRFGTITRDARGRARIWLGRSVSPVPEWREVFVRIRGIVRRRWVHPAATTGGWQYLSRFRAWEAAGRPLRRDEHAHHEDGNKANDSPRNISVLLAEYHGRLHGRMTVLWRLRDPLGRFLPDGERSCCWPRAGAVLGPSARC